MTYTVKEMFYTLQGEGANAGRPAVFCRFAGCNLWSGRESDRTSATCTFCDTDFVGANGDGGGRFETAALLAEAVAGKWPRHDLTRPFVVCTGGEPLLQLDAPLVDALHEQGFEIAVETNGSVEAPEGLDWVTVSPKAGVPLRVTVGQELKLVFPQAGVEPEQFEYLRFSYFYLQPMDGPGHDKSSRDAMRFCMERPLWRLSLQIHKILGFR